MICTNYPTELFNALSPRPLITVPAVLVSYVASLALTVVLGYP